MSDTEIELKWKGHKYDVNFDEFPNGLEQATLGDLKEKCKRITGVPVNAMKLLASGGKLWFISPVRSWILTDIHPMVLQLL
jgi:hypothetical protein